jgi:hypothetical protein
MNTGWRRCDAIGVEREPRAYASFIRGDSMNARHGPATKSPTSKKQVTHHSYDESR